MTLTLGLDLDRVKLNQRAKYVGQRSFSSKVVERTFADRASPDRLLCVYHVYVVSKYGQYNGN